ncbi:MAG: hypothetical protein V4722_20390, partial [Bacteroidota bacterium]
SGSFKAKPVHQKLEIASGRNPANDLGDLPSLRSGVLAPLKQSPAFNWSGSFKAKPVHQKLEIASGKNPRNDSIFFGVCFGQELSQ